MRKTLLAAAMLALVAAPAVAGEHYYFYKAGVDRDTFKADKIECEKQGARSHPAQAYQAPASNLYAVAAVALVTGFMRAGERRRMSDATQIECMADKGYSQVSTTEDVIKDLDRLKGDDRIDRMADLAAEGDPTGEFVQP